MIFLKEKLKPLIGFEASIPLCYITDVYKKYSIGVKLKYTCSEKNSKCVELLKSRKVLHSILKTD